MDLVYNGKYPFFVSLLFGTFVGLIVKYILDKKYIFYYKSPGFRNDIIKFVLYSFMGLLTTIIFWGAEFLFYYSLNFSYAKYLGGLFGLALGYFIKYHLDKKFVFINK